MWWLLHVLFNHTEHSKYLPVALLIFLSLSSQPLQKCKQTSNRKYSIKSHWVIPSRSFNLSLSVTHTHIPTHASSPLLLPRPRSHSACLGTWWSECTWTKRVRRGRDLKTCEHNRTHAVSAFHSLLLAHLCVYHCLLTGLSIAVLFSALYQNLFLSFHLLSFLFIFVYPFCQSCKSYCSFLFC